MPGGELVLTLKNRRIIIPAQDELGDTYFEGKKIKMQEALDNVYLYLQEEFEDQRYIWDLKVIKKWGKSEASEKQKEIIKYRCRNIDVSNLTKGQASLILNRLFYKPA